MNYERLNQTGFLFTETAIALSILKGSFGDGYEPAAALIGSPSGLRTFNIKIEGLPDQSAYKVDVNARTSLALGGNPSNDDVMTIGGKTYTFKTSGPTGDQIQIGSDAVATAFNVVAKVNADKVTTLCTASANGNRVDLMANTAGIAGNSIAVATDGVRIQSVAFTNGTQTRARYIWDLFVRSKINGDRPFEIEDPMDTTGATILYGCFADDALNYPILCSLIYSAGLSIRQRRIRS